VRLWDTLILSELRKGRPSQPTFHALGFGGAASKPRPLGEGGYRVPYFGGGRVVAGRRIWRARSRQDALRDSGQAGATNHACATRSLNLP
jgi:hypothetical protein